MKDEELRNQNTSRVIGKVIRDKDGMHIVLDDPEFITQEQKKIKGKQILNEGV